MVIKVFEIMDNSILTTLCHLNDKIKSTYDINYSIIELRFLH